jgi:uncharacterized protein YjaZ
MKIVDLTDEYKKQILDSNNLPDYEKSYAVLFAHYFEYWADRGKFSCKLEEAEITKRRDMIMKELPIIEEAFNKNDFDISELRVVLFVGMDVSNGHAFVDAGEVVVWLPVEGYNTAEDVRVFVTHEIVHALQYKKNSEFVFGSKEEKNNLFRELVTEGLATYASQKILGISEKDALWSDYMSDEKYLEWHKTIMNKFAELSRTMKENDLSGTLFRADNPDNPFEYRAGYYLGYEFIKVLADEKKLSLAQLFDLSKGEYYKELEKFLKK